MRDEMIEKQLMGRGIRDPRVLEIMRKTDRHLFVPANLQSQAYNDNPLPIGYEQTISQPYMVAYMTEALRLKATDKVLEIGTGSGYQAAVLSPLVQKVYTLEVVKELAESAKETLKRLGYQNIEVKHGDGYQGWPETAPFDAILLTAAPEAIPEKLAAQLKEGGRMILPVGRQGSNQDLILLTKTSGKIEKENLFPVRFVPMVKSE